MSEILDRLQSTYRRLPPWAVPVIVIVLAVLAGNVLYVLGLANIDPISWTSAISKNVCRITCGRPSIDPNVGALTQSLGYRAAMDLLHGHLPWWNYFEGLGQPLVGEMQAAALFPFTLMLALPSGLLWMHVVLESLAGISTYFLARRICLPALAATMAGALWALNGTFAWIANAVVNPLAFLPMLLLGVEIILSRSSSPTKRGWYLAAIALALSLYSGFPEGAFFDAIFCGVWAIVRLFALKREIRLRAVRRLGLAAVVGVVLAIPALVPFADFLKVAYVGGHTSAGLGHSHLQPGSIPMLFNPYIYGTIFGNTHVFQFWDVVGGYFTVSISILALVGVVGSRLRPVRIFLAAWVVAALAGAFNVLDTRDVWNLIPLVNTSAFPRYIISSCEFALILLAGFGLVEIFQSVRARRLFTTASVVMGLVLIEGFLSAHHFGTSGHHDRKAELFLFLLTLIPVCAVVLLLILGRLTKFRWAPFVVALVVVGESLLYFIAPMIEAPKSITIDTGPIAYLQTHQGQERYLDLHVLLPNWGSQYGLNSLSAIDLPFPTAFLTYIQNDLYPGLSPKNEFLVKGSGLTILVQEQELAAHFKYYEDASLKYLLVPTKVTLTPQLVALGLKPVYKDATATIYELPDPRPFFSSTCTVSSPSDNLAYANCSTSGATLLRTELSMPGWKITVNGQVATVTTIQGVFQEVTLPKGQSVVRYSFLPPHEKGALFVGVLAFLFLVIALIDERWTITWLHWYARTRETKG